MLHFFASLGCEYSLYSHCKTMSFPRDFWWVGALLTVALMLTLFLKREAR